jgi:hypothetical protein
MFLITNIKQSTLGACLQAMIDRPASEGLIILLDALYAVLATRSESGNLKAAEILIEKLVSFPDDLSYPLFKIQKMIIAANSEKLPHHLNDKLSDFHRRFGEGE